MDFEVKKRIRTILENMENSPILDLSEYDNEDFLEVFFSKFRPWVKATHGDEAGTLPMSYLIKKYINEFSQLYMRELPFGNVSSKAVRLGKEIVSKGEHQLTSLRPQHNFLEKYAKPLKFFVEDLNLPDFIQIKFNEPKPYRANMEVIVDFEEFLKYDGDVPSLDFINGKFRNFLTNYLGIDFGKSSHGGLNFTFPTAVFNKYEERWVKDDLNKIIKKEIKKLPSASSLRGIKFIPNHSLGSSQLQMLKHGGGGYYRLGNIKTEIGNLLSSLGYSGKYLRVTS
jgi:hypothetical protein